MIVIGIQRRDQRRHHLAGVEGDRDVGGRHRARPERPAEHDGHGIGELGHAAEARCDNAERAATGGEVAQRRHGIELCPVEVDTGAGSHRRRQIRRRQQRRNALDTLEAEPRRENAGLILPEVGVDQDVAVQLQIRGRLSGIDVKGLCADSASRTE